MQEIKRVAVYIRVSTTMQDEIGSLEIQKKKMLSYCKEQNYEIFEVYEDIMSGASSKRKAFKRLETILSLKQFDAVVVWSSDRLSRNLLTRLIFLNELTKHDIAFISVTEPQLSTTTPEGRLMLNITGAIAEHERVLISKRTRSGMYKRAEENKYLGGSIPYGYKVNDKGEFIVDLLEVDDVKRMFRLIKIHRSAKKVSELMGINYHTLLMRLKHPIYAGGRTYGKRPKDVFTGKRTTNDKHLLVWDVIEPIISKEEWKEVQDILSSNQKKFATGKINRKYLFSGMIVCSCGGKLFGNMPNRKKMIEYYRCDNCGKRLNMKKVDKVIIEGIFKDEKIKLLNSGSIKEIDYYKEIEELEKKIRELEDKKDDFIELFNDGLIKKEKLKERLNRLNTLIEADNKELIDLKEKILKLQNTNFDEDNMEMLRKILESDTDKYNAEIREILNLIIRRIYVHDYSGYEIEVKL
ncbi:hypothetical protein PM10SUCC1_00410 [Propionigenium maris DSM 9537]|uniref:Site-specific DNA recombinase n=1 Tax=Propionigenium maris DSM 9537 TaxID=1123000 RepID=A0A9W6LKR5_9FUSO|nr:recombinase family protein [Propionigenium maris]GLI54526.1 hypothetical protein PM10SUCC1_00410 [Propionigenium maris DSM 9537]